MIYSAARIISEIVAEEKLVNSDSTDLEGISVRVIPAVRIEHQRVVLADDRLIQTIVIAITKLQFFFIF